MAALVQKAGSGKTGRGTADGRDRNPGVQETRGSRGERCPAPGVPHVGARQDEQIAVGGIEVIEDHVGHDAEPAHGGDRLARLGNCHDVPRTTGEAAGTQLDKEITDLPIGEVSYRARCAVEVLIDNILSYWQHVVKWKGSVMREIDVLTADGRVLHAYDVGPTERSDELVVLWHARHPQHRGSARAALRGRAFPWYPLDRL